MDTRNDPDVAFFFPNRPASRSCLGPACCHYSNRFALRMNEWKENVDSNIEIQRIRKGIAELDECRFQPVITSRARRVGERASFGERQTLFAKRRSESVTIASFPRAQKIEHESHQHTFVPDLSPTRTHRRAAGPVGVPNPVNQAEPTMVKAIPRINSIPRRMSMAIDYASRPVFSRLFNTRQKATYVAVPIPIPRQYL